MEHVKSIVFYYITITILEGTVAYSPLLLAPL